MGIKKHIPNSITCLNLLSGSLSIILSFNGEYKSAVLLIILAAVFDFFDGFAARVLKSFSKIGKELDSLADLISFGLAPSLLLYNKMQEIEVIHPIVRFIPLVVAVASALRLAKFNVDTRQTVNFIGLPTPACALIIGSILYYTEMSSELNMVLSSYQILLPILSIILSLMLVSEMPMFSFKLKNLKWKDNRLKLNFVVAALILGLVFIIMGLNWSLWVLAIFVAYILTNIVILIDDFLSPPKPKVKKKREKKVLK